jgi:hypothetical protein
VGSLSLVDLAKAVVDQVIQHRPAVVNHIPHRALMVAQCPVIFVSSFSEIWSGCQLCRSSGGWCHRGHRSCRWWCDRAAVSQVVGRGAIALWSSCGRSRWIVERSTDRAIATWVMSGSGCTGMARRLSGYQPLRTAFSSRRSPNKNAIARRSWRQSL